MNYILKFVKSPVATLREEELSFKDAVLLLAVLPFAAFLAIWSLINRLIPTFIMIISGAMGGLGSLILPSNPENLHADAMAATNWSGIFVEILLLVAVWFLLMMFVPVLAAKIFKCHKKICLQKLFIQTTVLTIPMSTMLLVATVFGFIGLPLWFLAVIIALIIPILLQFFVVGTTWKLGSDKSVYIVIITQIVVIIIAGLLFASLAAGIGNSLMGSLFL